MFKSSIAALAALIITAGATHAAQLNLLVGGAMSEPFREMGAEFAKKTGNTLDFVVDTTGQLQNKLRGGAKADVILVSSPGMEALIKEKRIVEGTRVDLARALIGVSVKSGAPSPDLSSVDAFKKAVLSARTVSYVDPKAGGTSGNYMAGLFQKMGLADQIKSKIVFRDQGSRVADAVAKGDAEIGITFISEMQPNKGVRVVGPLPDAIQSPTIYAAAIPVGAPNADAARAFLKLMASEEARGAIMRAGLEPLSH
jgi:molybdate transport system substrate-binding protein